MIEPGLKHRAGTTVVLGGAQHHDGIDGVPIVTSGRPRHLNEGEAEVRDGEVGRCVSRDRGGLIGYRTGCALQSIQGGRPPQKDQGLEEWRAHGAPGDGHPYWSLRLAQLEPVSLPQLEGGGV